jgi:N-acetylglucosaminyl-diphospho-decaprenol L-rhamnosyltransferase
MSVGAVIVTYNSAKQVSQAIRSLWGNGVTDIIVVDNASTDHTLAILKRLGIMVVSNSHNIGFGSACNQGSSYLNHPYILFLNPDARLQPRSLALAVKYLQSHPDHAVAGLSLHQPNGQPETNCYGSPVTLGSLLRKRPPSSRLGWVSAGALLLRRRAFNEINGFDPTFFMYWEDVDLCRRFQLAGWKIGRVPQAQVIHLRGASSVDSVQKTSFYDAGADKYFQKHYAAPIWILQRLLRRFYRLFSPRAR